MSYYRIFSGNWQGVTENTGKTDRLPRSIYDKLESISSTLKECLKFLYDEKGEDEINENLEENNELDNSNDKSSFGPYQLLNLINKCRSDY